jgi:HSP20 family protein
MSLVNWTQRPLLLDSLAQDFFTSFPSFFPDSNGKNITIPSVNIKETEKSYDLEMAIPGFEKKDFKLEVKNKILYISGERRSEKEMKEMDYSLQEYNFSGFSRSFVLPKNASPNDVKADYMNGILHISIAKDKSVEMDLSKTIPVS